MVKNDLKKLRFDKEFTAHKSSDDCDGVVKVGLTIHVDGKVEIDCKHSPCEKCHKMYGTVFDSFLKGLNRTVD